MERMKVNLGIMTKDQLKKLIVELDKENKKLKEYNGELIENHKKDIAILCEENKKLKEENETLQIQVENLEPNYENWYNLINWEREDHQKFVHRLLINNLILIIAIVADLIVLLCK